MKSDECRQLLPEDVYDDFCNAAASEDFWEGTPYSWENTAVVIATHYTDDGYVGPFITTEWNQTGYYNKSGYGALGCVTIAVAQLMNYYKHPSTYDWDKMPNKLTYDGQSSELTDFLKTLRKELKVTDDGGSSIYNARNTMSSYGYNVTIIDHNDYDLYQALRDRRPVYARGFDIHGFGGHAWVIDGYRDKYGDTEYILYRLSDAAYPEFEYTMTEPDMRWGTPMIPVPTYHMNWGWGGKCNGWYVDNRPDPSSYDFDDGRMELIIDEFN